MYALNLDKDTNRCLSATYPEYAGPDDVFATTLPEAVESYNRCRVHPMPQEANLHNYLYINSYIYAPLPISEEVDVIPSQEERISALEIDIAETKEALEMILSGVSE